MKGWERLDDHEIEQRCQLAAELVKGWQDTDNPNIRLAPDSERVFGEEAVTIEVIGIVAGLKRFGQKNDALKRLIPGADLDTEVQPNKTKYRINIPLWAEVSKQSTHKPHAGRGVGGKPSEVWLMFLVMVQSVLGTVLYFRLQ